MDNYFQKIFSIHFPEKKVYIENTYKSLYDKMEDIKNNKDHQFFRYSKNIQIQKLELSVIKMEVVIKSL